MNLKVMISELLGKRSADVKISCSDGEISFEEG